MLDAVRCAREFADEVEILDVTFDDAPLPGSMLGTEAAPVIG